MADFRNIITVEPVLFLYMLCTIMTTPLLQQLAFQKICQEAYGAKTCQNLTKSQENIVHSKTSKWILYRSIASSLPSVASSLILGSWSDKVGRKVVLLLPCVGSLLLYANHILNVVFFWANVDYLLIGTFISGFFGGFAAILLGVFSYISDVSDTMQRTVRVAVLESMIFLGGGVGNLIGGVLVQYYGYLAAFGLAFGLNVLVVIYVIFVLRESYFPPERREEKWAVTAVHKHIKALFQVMIKRRPLQQRLNIAIIIFGVFPLFVLAGDILEATSPETGPIVNCKQLGLLFTDAQEIIPVVITGIVPFKSVKRRENLLNYFSEGFIGFNDITVLYSKHSPRNFTPLLIGYLFAEVCFVKGFGTVLWVPLLSKVLHLSDLTIANVGAVVSAASYTFFGFAVNNWMIFLGGAITLGNSMALPCLRSRLSKQVEPTEQGTMFALLASVEVVGTLLASVIFNTIYSYTVDWLAGFCYFLMSGLCLVALCLLVPWLQPILGYSEYQEKPHPITQFHMKVVSDIFMGVFVRSADSLQWWRNVRILIWKLDKVFKVFRELVKVFAQLIRCRSTGAKPLNEPEANLNADEFPFINLPCLLAAMTAANTRILPQ